MTEDPKPNLDLLRRVLKQIDEHPETWYQDAYAKRTECGTVFCIAGHAVVLSGLSVDFDDRRCPGNTCWSDVTENGDSIPGVAQELLGLTNEESDELFSAGEDRAEIQWLAEQIAARAGEKL